MLTELGWVVGGKEKHLRMERPGARNPVNPPSPHPDLRERPARQKGVRPQGESDRAGLWGVGGGG